MATNKRKRWWRNGDWNAIDFTRFARIHNWNDSECFQLLTATVINYTLNCTSKNIPHIQITHQHTYTLHVYQVYKNRFTFCIHYNYLLPLARHCFAAAAVAVVVAAAAATYIFVFFLSKPNSHAIVILVFLCVVWIKLFRIFFFF